LPVSVGHQVEGNDKGHSQTSPKLHASGCEAKPRCEEARQEGRDEHPSQEVKCQPAEDSPLRGQPHDGHDNSDVGLIVGSAPEAGERIDVRWTRAVAPTELTPPDPRAADEEQRAHDGEDPLGPEEGVHEEGRVGLLVLEEGAPIPSGSATRSSTTA